MTQASNRLNPTSDLLTIAVAKYFQPISTSHPLVGIAIFLVIVLNLFGHLTRPGCNFALRVLQVLVRCALEDNGNLSRRHKLVIDHFPTDIRTVRKVFDLDPELIIYATCPRCCYTHPPTFTKDSKVANYPSRCPYIRYKGGKPCNAKMTKSKVQDGESVRVPIRPFAYQSFQAFVARFLARPGVEDMIDRAWEQKGTEWRSADDMWDIWDGQAVHELEGVDKKPFSERPASEARLVWNLSIDWFNPFMNKQSGKTVSTGSMAMACLNLPPSMRHKPENMWLTIIPGPREPETDQVNHFLRPLVEDLRKSWTDGTWYTRTYRHPEGRRARSILCNLVTDLPGGKKAAGGSAGFLSPFYSYQRVKDVNNILDHVSDKKGTKIGTHLLCCCVDLDSSKRKTMEVGRRCI